MRPANGDDIATVVRTSDGRGLVPRGLGRSYGDAALCAGGTVLDLSGLDRILEFDPTTGVLVAQAGTSLAQVRAHTQGRGWIPPVLPGTAHVTLGGAVAADVHGKNHVSAGSFGTHVRWLDLLRADGSTVRLSPPEEAVQFWATVGGMGLTGVILAVSLQLRRAGGSALRHRRRVGALSEVLWLMDAAGRTQAEDDGLHAVAWLDAAAPGSNLGRGIVETARVLASGEGAPSTRAGSTTPGPTVPSLPGPGIVSAPAVRIANSLRWHGTRESHWSVGSIDSALQPLDRAEYWPAAFGRGGLVQCQVAVPEGAETVLLQILRLLRTLGLPPALATVKRFGAADPAPLSFATPGWTLALDFPARRPALTAALTRVHTTVAESGGRAYLAKDARMSAVDLSAMYPRLAQWRRVRDAMDPEHRFASDLGRRLGLVADAGGGARR